MKTKITVIAFLAVTAGAFAYTRPHKAIPSDLRDAPADSDRFDTSIPVFAKGGENVPEPKAVEAVDTGINDTSKSIYGTDDRLDYYAARKDRQALADSVVSFWSKGDVEIRTSFGRPDSMDENTVIASLGSFGATLVSSQYVCRGERFSEQPVGAFCSGVLVGKDLVMTAGHCITDEYACRQARIVFGYAVKKEGDMAVTRVPADEVYNCSRILKRFQSGEPGSPAPAGQKLGPDFALIQLDREVKGHKPLVINRNEGVKAGDGVFVIGHPLGLPLKVAGAANVRDNSKVGYFVADLDTFGGNSGSPVFNASTKKIEGILVRGANDMLPSPDGRYCLRMATYEQTGGRGEDVTKISVLADFIPKLQGE